MLYSYLLDPTYSSHALAEVALRRFNLKLSGSLAESADVTGRVSSALRAEVEHQGLNKVYEEIDLPLVPVLARMEQAGVKIDCPRWPACRWNLSGKSRSRPTRSTNLPGRSSTSTRPSNWATCSSTSMNLPKPVKYGKGKTISTAVDVLEELAEHHHDCRAWCWNTASSRSSNQPTSTRCPRC